MMTRLPTEYQEVEYLRGTGTQYIRTGYFGTNNTGLKIRFRKRDFANTGIFGSRDSTTPTNSIGIWGTTDRFWRCQYGRQNFVSTKAVDLDWHTCEYVKNVCYLDKEILNTFNPETFQNSYEQILFGINSNTTTLSGLWLGNNDIGVVEYRENGILICEFIPCYRKSDKVAGMYDLINHEFLENSGTGSFEVGRDVVYPDEYDELEYIQSTGAQWIDTDYAFKSDKARLEIKFMNTADNNGKNICSSSAENAKSFGFYQYQSDALTSYNGTNMNNRTPIPVKDGIVNASIETFGINTQSISIINGESFTANQTATIISNVTFGLFTKHDSNPSYIGARLVKARIYICKLWDNGVLVRDLIPCHRKSDGAIGMIDKLTGIFYTNAGTGLFIAGAVVKTPKTRITYMQGNDVPSAYHKLDYLQTSSGSKAYMITDYKQTNATTLKIVAEGAGWLMGGRTSSPITDGLGILTASQAIYAMYGSENKNVARNFTTGIHTYEIGRGGLWVDGEKLIDYTPQTFKSQSLMWLWNIDDRGVPNNSYFVGKIYSAQILENGQVVRDYVPVYRDSDGVNGMYDRCFGGFIANAGGGVFTRGSAVSSSKQYPRFIYTIDNILPAGYRQLESLNINSSMPITTNVTYQPATYEQVIKFNTKNRRQLIGFASVNTTYWGVTADNQYEVGPGYIIPATEKDPFEWHKVAFHTDGETVAGRQIYLLVDDESTVSRTGTGSLSAIHSYDWSSSSYASDPDVKYIKKTLDANNEVVNWLYPALRESDNAVGWYDIITNQFSVVGQAIAGNYYKQLRFIGV